MLYFWISVAVDDSSKNSSMGSKWFTFAFMPFFDPKQDIIAWPVPRWCSLRLPVQSPAPRPVAEVKLCQAVACHGYHNPKEKSSINPVREVFYLQLPNDWKFKKVAQTKIELGHF